MPKKKKKKKDDGSTNNKRAEVKVGQLHTMFMSSLGVQSGIDFGDLGEDNKFTCYKFHFKGWGAQDFEGHALVAMHNSTRRSVPFT